MRIAQLHHLIFSYLLFLSITIGRKCVTTKPLQYMKYTHKHTQLYIMYTKQLQVIINDKAVHKKIFFCFFEQNKTDVCKTKTSFQKKQTNTVLSGKTKTHCLSRIYTAKENKI